VRKAAREWVIPHGRRRSGLARWIGFAVAFLVFLEIGLRIVYAVPRFSDALFVNDDASWRRKWVERRKASEVAIYHSFDRYHPTLGWASKPGLRDVTVFGDEVLNTNARGLRGKRDFPYESAGRPRIVVLGDSFTFGEDVSDDETYAHVLQSFLPKADVLNMGVHGYGHDQMLVLLREEGLKYRPDVVLVGFVIDDVARNVLGFRDFAKPRFVADDGALERAAGPLPEPDDVLRWDWLRPRIWDAASLIAVEAQTRWGWRQAVEAEVTRLILKELIAETLRAGAVPVLAYLPYGDELYSAEDRTPGEAFLFSICEANPGAHCLSTRPFFRKRTQAGMRFRSPFHWDATGHRIAAEAIYDYVVRKRRLLSPAPSPSPSG
jgi:hypothetical protein